MSVEGPDELLHTVLPPALEVLTAWSIAETEADPSVFRQAMDRTIGEAASAQDPLRGLAEMIRPVLTVRHPARRARPDHRPIPQRGPARRPLALPRLHQVGRTGPRSLSPPLVHSRCEPRLIRVHTQR